MHLHVGKNNVIGRSFSDNENVKVVSHNELFSVKISDYNTISISAFNNAAKESFIGADDMIKYVVANACPSNKILYFSTARVLNENANKNHYFYVKNKLAIERYLFDNHENVRIIYIPNIIPKSNLDRCDFIDIFINNLVRGCVEFDCSLSSSWNFISVDKLVEACFADRFMERRTLFLSKEEITVSDFLRFASYHTNINLRVRVGEKTKKYPDLTTLNCELLYSDMENSHNKLLWVKKRLLRKQNG